MSGQKAPHDQEHSADTLSEFHSERTGAGSQEKEDEALSFDKGDAKPDARYDSVELDMGFNRNPSNVPTHVHLFPLHDASDSSSSVRDSAPVTRRSTRSYDIIFGVLVLGGLGLGLWLWGGSLLQPLYDAATSLTSNPLQSAQPAPVEPPPAQDALPAAPDSGRARLPESPAAPATPSDNSRTSAPAASADAPPNRPAPSPAAPAPPPSRSAKTEAPAPSPSRSAASPVIPSPSPTRSAPSATKPAPPVTRTPPSQPDVTSAASTGKLFAITRPIGAQVFLDDKLVGTTPLFLSGLTLGTHQVRLELQGFKTYSSPIRIEPTDRFHLAVQLEE